MAPFTPTYSPANKMIYARHLDSALDYDKIDFYRQHPLLWKKRYARLQHEHLREHHNGAIHGRHIFSTLERYLTALSCDPALVGFQSLDSILSVVENAVSLQVTAHCSNIAAPDVSRVTNKIATLRNHPDLTRVFRVKKLVLHIHDNIEKIAMTNSYPCVMTSAPFISFHTDLIVVRELFGGSVILPYDFLLCVLDKMESTYLTTLYALLASTTPNHHGIQYYDHYTKIYALLDQAVEELGDSAYKFLKALEPLSVGVVLQTLPAATNDHDFLPALLADLTEADFRLAPFIHLFVDYQTNLLHIHGHKAVAAVLEMYGQEKMHFYPIICAEGGLIKMYRYGTAVRSINPAAVKELVGQFNKEWIVAKYEKDGCLVPILKCPWYSTAIQALIESGNPHSLAQCNKIPLTDWATVLFDKHCDFNYFPDTLDLLDDKGICPPRSAILQIYAQDALTALGQSGPLYRSNTRLVLEMLRRPTVDICEYFNAFEETGIIPPEFSVIQLKPKERELKKDPREFSILTFEARMCASACERNIADNILNLFHTHSMSSTGSELKHTIDNLATLTNSDIAVWVIFHIDLEQWNYTFRAALVAHFILILNSIFGVEHYNLAIRLFSQSTLLTSGKYSPPGTPGEFTHWSTHSGGNQGIFQKLWTIITIMIIRRVMTQNQWTHHMVGAGDNQVVAVQLPLSGSLKQRVELVKKALEEGFAEAGLTVKLAETWHSDQLIAYQRKYHYQGLPVPNAVKLTTRAFSGAADMNSGLNATISTSMNAGVSISEATCDPLIGIVCAYVESYTTLLATPALSAFSTLSVDRLTILSLVGSEMGHLPFLQLPQFLFSGHKDPLSDSLGLLKQIWTDNVAMRPLLNGYLSLQYGEVSELSDVLLVTEPGSLNIRKPVSAEAIMRTAVEEYLTSSGKVNNVQLRNLFRQLQPASQAAMARELLTITPVHLSLVAALYQYSEVGHVVAVLNRFNKLSSVVRMVNFQETKADKKDFQTRIREVDRRNASHYVGKAKSLAPSQPSFEHQIMLGRADMYEAFCVAHSLSFHCAFSVRLFLVSATFGKFPHLLIGPFIPPSSEQLRVIPDKQHEDYRHSIQITPAKTCPRDWKDRETTRGPFSLLIGSKTKDPVRNIRLVNLEGITAGKALQVLMKVYAWLTSTGADGTLLREVRKLIETRAPELGQLLTGLSSGTAGGTFTHRFNLPGSVVGCYSNSGSMMSTWNQISTNHATEMQRGDDDRFIFFQECFQMIISVLRLSYSLAGPILVGVRFDCCSYVIPDEKFQSPNPNLSLVVLSVAETKLAPRVSYRLCAEALHYLELQALQPLAGVPTELALAGYLAFQLCAALRSYRLGVVGPDQTEKSVQGPQSTFNITVMRKVPLSKLLTATLYQLGLTRGVSKKGTLTSLIDGLKTLLSTFSALQDVSPYRPFLEAIIVSGHLPALARLAKAPVRWETKGNHIVLLPILFKALIETARTQIMAPVPALLVVEIRTATQQWNRIWTFMRAMSPSYRLWERTHYKWSREAKLGYFSSLRTPLRVCVVPDADLVLEYGRRCLISPSVAPTPMDDSQPSLCTQPVLDHAPSCSRISQTLRPSDRLAPDTVVDPIVALCREQSHSVHKTLTAIGRWNAVSSGARCKVLEMVNRAGWTLDEPSLVVCLAEGAGSYLSSLLHLYPRAQGLYNSLVSAESMSHAYSGMFIPPELICPCSVLDRVLNIPYHPCSNGDLAVQSTWDELLGDIGHADASNTLITWDMEGQQDTREALLLSLYNLLTVVQPQRVIVKLFASDFGHDLRMVIVLIMNLYSQVWLDKPVTSNLYSEELFLMLQWAAMSEPLVKMRDWSVFFDKWALLVSSHMDIQIWSDTVNTALWLREAQLCPSSYPSTTDSTGPLTHPICDVLYRVDRILTTVIDAKIVNDEDMERGFQHMLQSQALGSTRTQSILQGELIIVDMYMELFSNNPWVEDQAVYWDQLLAGYPIVVRAIDKLKALTDEPHIQTHLHRFIGEVLSCASSPNSAEFIFLLARTQSRLQLLPGDWMITKALSYGSSWVMDVLARLEFEYPDETLWVLDSTPIKEAISSWVSRIAGTMKTSTWEMEFHPLCIQYWFQSTEPSIVVESTSRVAVYLGSNAGTLALGRGLDNFDYFMIWGSREERLLISGTRLVETRWLTPVDSKYKLQLLQKVHVSDV